MSNPPFQQHLNPQALGDTVVRNYRDLIRVRKKVYALEAEAILRRAGREPKLPIEFTSQFGEDLFAWDMFGGQTDGFFVEAGAFDGYRFSVTYPFEAVGWTGLLVEPHPVAYEKCVARRPNSHVVHAALGGPHSPRETEFVLVADAMGGMMSHMVNRGHPQDYRETPTQRVRVPVTTLNECLAPIAQDRQIDLLVLDVEGGEFDALDAFDINRYRPRLMIIEHLDREAMCRRLAPFPYHHVGNLEMNMMFIRNDEADMIERFRWMLM